jgi:hypothetical protein
LELESNEKTVSCPIIIHHSHGAGWWLRGSRWSIFDVSGICFIIYLHGAKEIESLGPW